jgi:hypothetical protein
VLAKRCPEHSLGAVFAYKYLTVPCCFVCHSKGEAKLAATVLAIAPPHARLCTIMRSKLWHPIAPLRTLEGNPSK